MKNHYLYFNSIKVRLELPSLSTANAKLLNFNSIKVRLEHNRRICYIKTDKYFNSIKVRLERAGDSYVDVLLLFQFHKGTIRTIRRCSVFRNPRAFQFHKGTIRTVIDYGCKGTDNEFQFHKGTIRTSITSKYFNFANISIP